MTNKNEIKNVENYFAELRKADKSIIKDGIVNHEKYKAINIKLLWILKEPHCNNGGGWAMKEHLSSPKGLINRTDDFKWKNTYKLMMLCTWGIFRDFQSWKKSLDDWSKLGSEKLLEVFNDIALINIKKTLGGSASKNRQIKNAFNTNKELIVMQIKEYEPDIIICGGTHHFIRDIIEETGALSRNKFVKAYHPNQKSISHENYYNYVLSDAKKVSF
ncbi:MAG: hypothetical protein CVU00_02615 [Bacteroidetes bacterium HGW-Bacteroidetes-17]|jgi:hypothetical protein|nr:MAG: hypothetical protein CVU00_02615 [Bacteroidetes bacterium HGW-Bacteroidetes-17]